MSRRLKILVLVAVSAVASYLPGLSFVDRAGAAVVAPAALEAVACATTNHCVAIGGSQNVLVSDNGGASWSVQSDSERHYLYGIACVNSARCIAVGDAGTILISENGKRGKRGKIWAPVRSGTTEPLSSVSCPGGDRCYAVGDGGTVLATDNSGSSWDVVASGSSVIDGVACDAPTQCAAVTSNSEEDLYTQDGTSWSPSNVQQEALVATAPMNGISCSGSNCLAAGDHGLMERSVDGGVTWTFVYPAFTAQNLDGVDCPLPSRCVAVGSYGTVLTSNDGGATWTHDASPTKETLLGITCATPEDCLAVGSGQTAISTHDGGTRWVVGAGNAAPETNASVLVVGDSFAHTLALYVGRNARAYGVTLIDGGLDGCGLARGSILGNPGGTLGIAPAMGGACAPTGSGWPAVYRADIGREHPRLSLLVEGPWDLASRFVDGQWLSPGQAAYDTYYRDQMQTAVRILTSEGGRVAIATLPYVHSSGPNACAPAPATVVDCPTAPERVAALDAVARQVAAANPSRVTVINLGDHLSPGGRYDRTVDGVTVRAADGVHLSEPGGEWLTPWLVPRLLSASTGRK